MARRPTISVSGLLISWAAALASCAVGSWATLAALGAVGTADVFHGRLLFLDGEVRLVKNLTDLNHVAFVGGAPLRPFHELFFGGGLHHPITAQHFFRLDERPIGHHRLPCAEGNTPAGVERMKA